MGNTDNGGSDKESAKANTSRLEMNLFPLDYFTPKFERNYNHIFRKRSHKGVLFLLLLMALFSHRIWVELQLLEKDDWGAKTQFNFTVGQLQEFQTDLLIFNGKNGRYPTTAEGLQVLVANPLYRDFAGNTLTSVPKDPWGHAYIYRYPGTRMQPYDLFSAGPDGIANTSDDILGLQWGGRK